MFNYYLAFILFIAQVNVVVVVVKFSLPIIESISKIFSNVYTAAFKFSVWMLLISSISLMIPLLTLPIFVLIVSIDVVNVSIEFILFNYSWVKSKVLVILIILLLFSNIVNIFYLLFIK